MSKTKITSTMLIAALMVGPQIKTTFVKCEELLPPTALARDITFITDAPSGPSKNIRVDLQDPYLYENMVQKAGLWIDRPLIVLLLGKEVLTSENILALISKVEGDIPITVTYKKEKYAAWVDLLRGQPRCDDETKSFVREVPRMLEFTGVVKDNCTAWEYLVVRDCIDDKNGFRVSYFNGKVHAILKAYGVGIKIDRYELDIPQYTEPERTKANKLNAAANADAKLILEKLTYEDWYKSQRGQRVNPKKAQEMSDDFVKVLQWIIETGKINATDLNGKTIEEMDYQNFELLPLMVKESESSQLTLKYGMQMLRYVELGIRDVGDYLAPIRSKEGQNYPELSKLYNNFGLELILSAEKGRIDLGLQRFHLMLPIRRKAVGSPAGPCKYFFAPEIFAEIQPPM